MSDNTTTQILAALKRLDQRMERLEQRVDGIEQGQASMREALTTFRVDMMARMDRLQDTLVIEQQDRVMLMGAGERAETIAKAAQSEARLVGEQLQDLTKLVFRLQTTVEELRRER